MTQRNFGTFLTALGGLGVSIQNFAAYAIVAIMTALLLTLIAFWSGALAEPVPPPDGPAAPRPRRKRERLVGDFASKLAFALFGVSTAYFFSLVIDPKTMKQDSVSSIALSPFLTLLTAGITYLASKDRRGPDTAPTGVAAFIVTLMVSFYAMMFLRHG